MGKPPYEDADALDLMRADADQVELVAGSPAMAVQRGEPPAPASGFDVPSGAVELGGLHFLLD